MCDAQTLCTYNMEIYAGLQPEGPYKAEKKKYDSSFVEVTRLLSLIAEFARNVTLDYYYTSYSLVQSLLRDDYLTSVETLKKK